MRKFMLALTALLTPVLLSAPAFASGFTEDRGESVGGGRTSLIDTVTSAMDDLVDVLGEVWKVMLGNPLLVLFLAAGLFSLGVLIFRKAKSAAKR